jgi:hypothetical protein
MTACEPSTVERPLLDGTADEPRFKLDQCRVIPQAIGGANLGRQVGQLTRGRRVVQFEEPAAYRSQNVSGGGDVEQGRKHIITAKVVDPAKVANAAPDERSRPRVRGRDFAACKQLGYLGDRRVKLSGAKADG